MKKNRGICLVVLLFILSGLFSPAFPQVPVEISREKAVIAGTQYYIHTVKKGQTAYSIARAYNITVQELTAGNSAVAGGLREGQTLRIPVKGGSWVKSSEPVSTASSTKKDNTKYLYHTLKAGETVYAISRTYGVSANEIMSSNPGIDITKLPVGAEIAVPKKSIETAKQSEKQTEKMTDEPQKQKSNQQEKKYIYHKVEEGETLASIAQKYGTTTRILRKENKNLRFPKVGDYVRIPSENVPEPEIIEEPVVKDTVQITPEPVVTHEIPAGFTEIRDLSGSVDVAVLLPLYLPENSQRDGVDDWIYPRSLDFVEMYNGILLAADTLRSMGVNITLHTYDIKSDSVGLTNLIKSGKLDNMDLIIGPVYSGNVQITAEFAKSYDIPVVSPVSLINNSVLEGNPTLFMASSSLEVAQKQIAGKLADFNSANIVFVNSDTLNNDPEVKRYRNLILGDLREAGNSNPKLKEFLFYSSSSRGHESITTLGRSLSDNSENIIVIASEDPVVVSETVTIIHGLSKKFNVKVFAYPSVIFIENLDPRMFFDLDMLVFSPYRIDYTQENVQKFNISYLKKFMTMPLETSYAWIGYDIAYYFISGISMHGKEFVHHPEIHNPALLQNKFEFGKKNENDGYENQKLFKIRYSKNYEIRLEE
ncbi:MAG TPA: LysM peptidoglycan-binding domain-containing protein [Bacteroidales bacterium]|nr:LysM peptidoglycan-binding domain-containing protein [Bacteroidales bacterium]